jgi:hypothetical protein
VTAEIPLTGGRVTAGLVRIGDTVRRPITAAAWTVAHITERLLPTGYPPAA